MRAVLFLVYLMLAGCSTASSPGASSPAPTPPVAPVQSDATLPGARTQVDYRCTTDADCEIKDVGNCCGYYPACVNRDSPTFPAKVKAACAAEGTSSICGFPEISGCECVDGRCSSVTGATSGAELQ